MFIAADLQHKMEILSFWLITRSDGEIPYTAQGAQITPTSIYFWFLIIFGFYAYFRLG